MFVSGSNPLMPTGSMAELATHWAANPAMPVQVGLEPSGLVTQLGQSAELLIRWSGVQIPPSPLNL